MITLDKDYWDNRYKENTSKWDLGEVSPPIKLWANTVPNKNLTILIPGGGNSWEAEYLHNKGFKNVFVVDIAPSPLNNLKKRVPSFPKEHIIQTDFFKMNGTFDLIIEQTFFCAINPNLRPLYVKKANQLLNKEGKIIGLFFDAPLNVDKPPFGGSKSEYIKLFAEQFNILKMELTNHSIQSRMGRELFFEMIKI